MSWSKDWHSVHEVTGKGPRVLTMQRGEYAIYEDPGGMAGFPLPLGDISVAGPDGPVVLMTQSARVSPSDVGALFLGTGMFAPVAGFRAASSGNYDIRVRGQREDDKVLIGPTDWSALDDVAPWLACLVGGLALAVVGWFAARRDARRY
jgi:hypothetical protein